MRKNLYRLMIVVLLSASASAQSIFTYNAQSKLIPKDLGNVFLGMPFDQFAKQIDLKKATVNSGFEYLYIDMPFEKGNISRLIIKVHGLSPEAKAAILYKETVMKLDEYGHKFDRVFERIKTSEIPAGGIVYSIVIAFKADFDLKSFVLKTYGKDGEVRKTDDKNHFFDIQWTKKTSDGLTWLIRSFHEGTSRNLQLNGRIKGTEWDID